MKEKCKPVNNNSYLSSYIKLYLTVRYFILFIIFLLFCNKPEHDKKNLNELSFLAGFISGTRYAIL